MITPIGLESHSRLDIGGVGFNILWGDIGCFDDATTYRIHHAWIGDGVPVILSIEVVANTPPGGAAEPRSTDRVGPAA